MNKFDKFVDLTGQEPIFVGLERLVYADPRCPDWLIKVPRVQPARRNVIKNTVFRRYNKWRFGLLRSWYKEYEEYLSLLWRAGCVPGFIAGFYGFCQTSLGPGLVVEKIRDGNGDVAKTLAEIAKTATDLERKRLVSLVNAFFDEMKRHECVAKDLHAGNVVVAGHFERLVLVDGLGDGVLIKTKRFVTYLRRRDVERKRRRFLELIDGDAAMRRTGSPEPAPATGSATTLPGA